MMKMQNYLKTIRTTYSNSDQPHKYAFPIILFFIILFSVSLGIVYYISQRDLITIAPETLCPKDIPPSEINVLLLDMTDEFSEPQRLKVINEFEKIRSGIQKFGRIEVYKVDILENRVTIPSLTICNPGTGADLNKYYQNPKLAKKQWDQFANRLDSELQNLMSIKGSRVSPIFEAIQSTALRTFNRPAYNALPKHLIIVSDLLQNVPGKLSQYENMMSFQEFKKTPYFSDVRCDLTSVKITILYLVRPEPQKWPDHRKFWESYFLEQGAVIELLEPVYGAN